MFVIPDPYAPMLGTWINVGTVVVGTTVGGLLGERLKPQTHSTVTSVLGCVTCILGIENAMKTPRVLDAAPLPSQLGFFLVVLLSLLFGALLGETLDVEGWLHRLGQYVENRFGQSEGDFGKGFVTASLLFCVGPLTILGSFQDGLSGNYSLLATKAVLDGFAAMAFSAAFGWGVMLSAVTVLVVQGALTLSATAVQPWMTDVMVTSLTAAGGIILLGLGFRLLEIKQMRVANLLPALLLAPLFVAACNLVKPGFFPAH
jgi:uncharacterized membrane protein YqgA involved in biofilm formation